MKKQKTHKKNILLCRRKTHEVIFYRGLQWTQVGHCKIRHWSPVPISATKQSINIHDIRRLGSTAKRLQNCINDVQTMTFCFSRSSPTVMVRNDP